MLVSQSFAKGKSDDLDQQRAPPRLYQQLFDVFVIGDCDNVEARRVFFQGKDLPLLLKVMSVSAHMPCKWLRI